MKTGNGTLFPAIWAGFFALSSTGCSLLFVNAPASPRPGTVVRVASNCTTSQVAPVLDSIFGGLEAARVVYAASADESVYRDPNQPLSRGADIALGLGFTALFVGSSIYGYVATGKCQKLAHDRDDATDSELDRRPTEGRAEAAPLAPAAAKTATPAAPSPEAAQTPQPAAADDAPTPVDAEAPAPAEERP